MLGAHSLDAIPQVHYYRNTLVLMGFVSMRSSPMQFEIRPSSGVAIYRQIMGQVQAMVAGGRLQAGDLLPSVRQMAAEHEVNMMTVSKAYAKLEALGYVERVRGKGMRVCAQKANGTVAERQAELRTEAESLVSRGQQLRLTDEQILAVAKSILKERRS